MSFERMQSLFAKQLKNAEDQFESARNKVASCLMYQKEEECREKVRKFNESLLNYEDMSKTYLSVLDNTLETTQNQFDRELYKNYPNWTVAHESTLSPQLAKIKEEYSRNVDEYLTIKKSSNEFEENMLRGLYQKCVQEHASYWRNCQVLAGTMKELNQSMKRIEEVQAQNKKATYISGFESFLFSRKKNSQQNIEENPIEKLNEKLLNKCSSF